MTPLIAALLALTVIMTLARRRRRRLNCERLPRRLLPWLHPTRRRRRAEDDARRLLAALLRGGHVDPVGHLAAGIVLQPGEVSWATARTRLATHKAQSVWVTRTHLTWRGLRAQTVGHQHTCCGWTKHGRVDWLLTSQRIVASLPASGELVSIWWSTVGGLTVDLKRSHVALKAVGGWRASLDGSAVVLVAVAAVAGCHGVNALRGHPALVGLRGSPLGSALPRAPGPAGTSAGRSHAGIPAT